MADTKWLKDENNVKFFPRTHINSVKDDDGNTVGALLGGKADKSDTYTKAEVNNLIPSIQQDIVVGALPTTGSPNTIYRVPGTSSYTDWAWDGTQWVELATYNNAIDATPTQGSDNLVTSGGVYDNYHELDVLLNGVSYVEKDASSFEWAIGSINNAMNDYSSTTRARLPKQPAGAPKVVITIGAGYAYLLYSTTTYSTTTWHEGTTTFEFVGDEMWRVAIKSIPDTTVTDANAFAAASGFVVKVYGETSGGLVQDVEDLQTEMADVTETVEDVNKIINDVSVGTSGFQSGYLNTNGYTVGDTYVENISSSSAHEHLKVPVSAGDRCFLGTKSSSGIQGYLCPYFVLNSQNVIMAMNTSTDFDSLSEPVEIDIAENGTLCVHCQIASLPSFSLIINGELTNIKEQVEANTNNIATLQTEVDSSKLYKKVTITPNFTIGGYYNDRLQLVSHNQGKYCEIDVSQYVGCLMHIKTRSRGILYCGFLDEDNNVLGYFQTSNKTTDVGLVSDMLIIPIPRAVDMAELSGVSTAPNYKAAAKLRISSWTTYTDGESITIMTECYDKRLKGKNIAIVGDSSAAVWMNTNLMNYGWFLYHLAPLFGYTISARAQKSTSWVGAISQFASCVSDVSSLAKNYFDIIICAATGSNDASGSTREAVFNCNYDDMVRFCIEKMENTSNTFTPEKPLTQASNNAISTYLAFLNNSPRARIYHCQNFNAGALAASDSSILDRRNYFHTFVAALCDVFNSKPIDFANGTAWRSYCEVRDAVLSPHDYIHACMPRGGYEMWRFIFGIIWADMLTDSFVGSNE